MGAGAHIAVVDPGRKYPELDTFNAMNLAYRGALPLTYHQPGLFGLDSLTARMDGIRGLVILGSAASVHEGLPWQAPLHDAIAALARRGVPTLGICYGHQALAHVFGGEVVFMTPERVKLKGFRHVTLGPNRLWKGATAGELVVSHAEAVSRVPAGFRVIARCEAVACEAMEHESLPIWSFQAHPEATAGFMLNQGIPFDGDQSRFRFGHGLVQEFLAFAAARP